MRSIQVVFFLAALAAIECQGISSPAKIYVTGAVESIDCSIATSAEHTKYCTDHCGNAKGGIVILTSGSSGDSKGKGCSEADGFFSLPSSSQCFKAYLEQNTTWATATSFCDSEDLVLAEPKANVTADLQKYLNDKYGSETYWVNGRGTGPNVNWQRSGAEVSPSGDLWLGDVEENSPRKDYCLILYATNFSLKRSRGSPYDTAVCDDDHEYRRTPLCERIIE